MREHDQNVGGTHRARRADVPADFGITHPLPGRTGEVERDDSAEEAVLVDFDHAWFSGRLTGGRTTASDIVELVWRALNEAASYPSMRDALLSWCHGPDEVAQPGPAVAELFARLVDSRQHGFLRLLLLIERGGDAMPGKDLAARCLAEWRSRNQPQQTD
ncbi:hypothetical protein [Streptomyces sp. NPDC006510]|uniref:hypothetical protein n=1 Tax=Streptomyces sp. NPDC006510 TaxID=3155600 RepID=UPI0033A4AC92